MVYTIAIIVTQLESRYSFYCPTEGIDGWVDLGGCYIPRLFTHLQTVTHPSAQPGVEWPTRYRYAKPLTIIIAAVSTFTTLFQKATYSWLNILCNKNDKRHKLLPIFDAMGEPYTRVWVFLRLSSPHFNWSTDQVSNTSRIKTEQIIVEIKAVYVFL